MENNNKWWETRSYQFLKLPAVLFETDPYRHLSSTAKLLYALLLDRMGLSAANGWTDERGQVYIYYSIRDATARLSCGHDKVTKALRELESAGLLTRDRQGQGKPDRLYVLPFSSECDISANRNAEDPHSRTRDDRTQECENPAPNHTEKKHTYKNQTESSTPSEDRERMISFLKLRFDYAALMEQKEDPRVLEIIKLVADVLTSQAPTIRIGKAEHPTQEVQAKFRELNREHMEYILLVMDRNHPEIRNYRSYMLTTLYHAPDTMDSALDAMVAHDMAQYETRRNQ